MQFKVKLYRADEPVTFKLDQVSANIEGYDGDEVIIEAQPLAANTPEAAGLKQIAMPGRAKEDNLIKPVLHEDPLGVLITIPQGNFSSLNIKVPQSIIMTVFIRTYLNNSKISVNNVNSVSIAGAIPSVAINNVSEFVVKVDQTHIGSRATGKFMFSNIRWSEQPIIVNGQPRKRVYEVDSFNSDIDMGLPANITGNVIVCSEYGQAFSNLNFNPLPASDRDLRAFHHYYNRAAGQLQPDVKSIAVNNGGGFNILVGSVYGTIYLKRE